MSGNRSRRSVLVTGGAGFIGSHVVERFLMRGDEVSVVDDFSSGKRGNVKAGPPLYELDVSSAEFGRLVERSAFDVVVHLAAQMDLRKSVADPVFDARSNVLGAITLMEGIRASGKNARVVFSSTGGVIYGTFTTPPNKETFPKDPESPYAIAKLAVEYYLAYYARVHGIDSVSLRLGNVYGPRQDPRGDAGVIAIFCGNLLAGKPLTVFGDGLQTRDYVYVGDVCTAIERAADLDLPAQQQVDSRAFNIGTGRGTTVLELVEGLTRVSGRGAETIFAPRRPGEQQHSFVDVGKAARLLGWKPLIGLDEGLALTYEWLENEARTAQPA